MNNDKKMNELKENYINVNVPTYGLLEMEKRILQAKEDKKKNNFIKKLKLSGMIASAAVISLIVLPNSSPHIAKAMENIPIIGDFIRVVTIDEYYVEEDGYIADVKIPEIIVEQTDDNIYRDSDVIGVNKDITDYTKELIEAFKEDSKIEGMKKELNISYEVISDTSDWFTLKINVLEVEASGYEHFRYYHMNKSNQRRMELKDLFIDNSNYVERITNLIKEQMLERMEDPNNVYFIKEGDSIAYFEQIQSNQNFYFNQSSDLVIAFDEYEVAPGYMGSQEFVIQRELLEDILK